MDVGVMNGNIPAPLMAIDEDDEYFLTLSNVGMSGAPICSSSTRFTSTVIPTPRRSMTVCPMRRWRSTSAPASRITTWPRMLAHTSDTATLLRPSTCRWAWWDNFMCARVRAAFRPARACCLHNRNSSRICAPDATPRKIFCAAILCHGFPTQLVESEPRPATMPETMATGRPSKPSR